MADASATPTSAPLIFGRYRVHELLGETRLSSVYAATDERLHRQVLLHLLRKELAGQERPRARFISEIGQSARRSHQALLEVFDSGEAAGRPFMITEYVSGRPLRGLGVLTVEQALLYMRQVAGAVAACQSQASAETPSGLYHPPISSSNLLLVDEGRVKLVDSWLLPPGEALADQAHYRAPELSEGKPATPASAAYSLGLLLYELITGERPVSGEDARATALAHLTARIPPLAKARPTLYLPVAEDLVARATARYPEHRYASAADFATALDSLWRDLGASTQRLVAPSARPAAPEAPAALRIDPQPPAPAPRPIPRPSAPASFSITGRLGRQPATKPSVVRQRSLTRSIVGWSVMIGLLLLVAASSYVGVNALISQITRGGTPNLPSLPGLPSAETGGSPLAWISGFFGRDEIYIVNLAEGLNLRSQPDVYDSANIIAVVANGTPVTKLEGPVVKDNIPWLRVSLDSGGKRYEGWMSLNYLRQEQ
ncbi:SH3 domain-containing protein [Chloroflexales bacterium ZM16-3]|nr:SH3 domain-containing protein [Chloroflexales bacterium ZM16-3]